ncbi:MAG TPA: DUF2933 domain-containing protein [bacterium]|nr:DUF2933 domain-containing protein [bacterium]
MNRKHLFWMILGCTVPLAVLVALPLLGVSLSGIWTLLLFLFCPLIHLVMMRGKHGTQEGNEQSHEHSKGQISEFPRIPARREGPFRRLVQSVWEKISVPKT